MPTINAPKLVQREGFWKTTGDGGINESLLPKPIAHKTPWRGRVLFLKCLRKLQVSSACVKYKGSSHCRICEEKNGSGEYKAGLWVWPEGFEHYVKVHNVRPSLAFHEFVIGEVLE